MPVKDLNDVGSGIKKPPARNARYIAMHRESEK